MPSPTSAILRNGLFILALGAASGAAGQAPAPGDAAHGAAIFKQSCALCHSTIVGFGNLPASGQGPGLAGIIGRKAGSLPNFNYSKALPASGITWDAALLDRFLSAPATMVPGTTMPIATPDAKDRLDIIAFLATLKGGTGPFVIEKSAGSGVPGDAGDWRNDAPGVSHGVNVAALPPSFNSPSAENGPKLVDKPAGAAVSVPAGFSVKVFASGLKGPRLVRVAPNGDIFIAETQAGRVRVLRAADGADAPSANEIFADGLAGPFGITFYPAGDEPQWVYVASLDSVDRFPYRNGDLKARGAAEHVVGPLAPHNGGGHTTRDVAFSKDGRRMFVTVGSGSNVAEGMETKTPDEVRAWEAEHGVGAAWGPETNRANILVTDPDGREPLRRFATGIRNPVGLAVDANGDLWTSTNERDGLGDNLVPDYITRVREGGFYGWPWYFMGNREDPRHAGERPDLAGRTITPDVPVQAHSATLGIVFYNATSGPAVFPPEYRGDLFGAFHGSWNRGSRTGYKVVRVRMKDGVPTGEYDDFLVGFVVDNRSVWGRPVGVGVARDGALLVTEDGNDTLLRIAYVGGAK